MRLLFLVHRFLPKHVGGAEITAYETAHALAREHEVCVAYPAEVSMPSYESWDIEGDSYQELPIRRLISAPPDPKDPAARHNIYNPAGVNALRACLDEIQPELVHIHSLGRLSAAAIWELKARGIPVVLTLHDLWFLCTRYHLVNIDGELCRGPKGGRQCLLSECYQYLPDRFDPFEKPLSAAALESAPMPGAATQQRSLGWRALRGISGPIRGLIPPAIKERAKQQYSPAPDPKRAPVPAPLWLPFLRTQLMRETLAEVDLLISPSRFLRDRFVEHGISPDRIRLLPNGIAANRFGEASKRPHTGLIFGYLGSLDAKKGVHDLVRAFNLMRPEEARCYIAGPLGGPYADKLQELSTNPSLTFVGSLPPDQVPEFYRDIDVFVLPSLCYENSPVTIHEAYWTGTPVIAVNAGGMAELVSHERSGLLYQRGDAEDLCRQLRRFIADPDLVPRMREHLPREASVTEVAATLLTWYSELVARSN